MKFIDVKAFYDRPLNYSSGLRSSGGGRVTEILIRPLFSLFCPELTNIVQPLSGEYAARREVLEIIPFPSDTESKLLTFWIFTKSTDWKLSLKPILTAVSQPNHQ